MEYSGPERRIHRVFVTQNTEYHVRQDTCVGVRNRRSGEWDNEHYAINLPVAGAIRFFESGAMTANRVMPQIGESMYFDAQGRDLVTSPVVSVERPRPVDLMAYHQA
jgi:hypothetical protein